MAYSTSESGLELGGSASAHAVPALILAAAVAAIAAIPAAIALLPTALVLPALAIGWIALGGVLAAVAWARASADAHLRDLAAVLAFFGCGAAALSESDNMVRALGFIAGQ